MFSFIDWGTSNFRAVLLDNNFVEIDFIETDVGILSLEKDEFYPYFKKILNKWLNKKVKFYISGMAGSIDGWQETKYLLCPIKLEELSQNLVRLKNIEEDICIVTGIKSVKDDCIELMRGEEIQVFGAMQKMEIKDGIFILPGTHSKWVKVERERVVDFKTNMSGEVFDLMSSVSILSKSIKSKKINMRAFKKGLKLSLSEYGVLNQMFQVRTQADKVGKEGAYSFLSAVIIGSEIRYMSRVFESKKITLIGTAVLNNLYKSALLKYGFCVKTIDAKVATKYGMMALHRVSCIQIRE